jgi:hypothetical protein
MLQLRHISHRDRVLLRLLPAAAATAAAATAAAATAGAATAAAATAGAATAAAATAGAATAAAATAGAATAADATAGADAGRHAARMRAAKQPWTRLLLQRITLARAARRAGPKQENRTEEWFHLD